MLECVEDNHVVGLGSGSTVEYAIRELGKLVKRGKLRITGVATSIRTEIIARDSGISLTTLEDVGRLDVAIDGADQVDRRLNLIKGKGGALAREKIVASAADRYVIAVDETKLTEKLGVGVPIPIEVLPFGASLVMSRLRELGGIPTLREAERKLGPVITDNGNFIVDVEFGKIDDLEGLNRKLKAMPGVVETGLFLGMADAAYVGFKRGGIEVLTRA